jgi:diamine N-acetyltransferase
MVVTPAEITDTNQEAVLALRIAPGQERFVGSVPDALADAAAYPHAKPWYRVVYADHEPVGFMMLSWNVDPRLPAIIGPWFLRKLLIDERYQGRGYGAEVVRKVVQLVRAEGATELLTSYLPDEGGRSIFGAGRLLRPGPGRTARTAARPLVGPAVFRPFDGDFAVGGRVSAATIPAVMGRA